MLTRIDVVEPPILFARQMLVDELIRCLSGLGPVTVTENGTLTEDVRFTLPKEVSQP